MQTSIRTKELQFQESKREDNVLSLDLSKLKLKGKKEWV